MSLQSWLVCYDIKDDRRRTRVAALLDGYGDRIQFSIFEILVSPETLEILRMELQDLIHLQEDRLAFFPQCSNCRKRQHWFGLGANSTLDEQEDFIL
jgi:CRISPR-associated protein Cas2